MENMYDLTGKTFSHYRIIEKLGQGGMGVVYKAEDTRLKRMVAMKFLLSRTLVDEESKMRFIQEAQATARLDHPNICTVYEIGDESGQTYIVMAFLDGETLKERLQRLGPLDFRETIDYTIQIAKGLREAHEAGIIHRDIKSANIMITRRGQIKVMDFGVAKVLEGPQLTKVGSTVGTLSYMSPEQFRGETVDHRSDVWSLGILVYEMLTGSTPFRGSEYDVMNAIMQDNPKPLSNFHTDIPLEMENIVNRCLEKKREDRYQDLREMIMDLYEVWKMISSTSRSYSSYRLGPDGEQTVLSTSSGSFGGSRRRPADEQETMLAGRSSGGLPTTTTGADGGKSRALLYGAIGILLVVILAGGWWWISGSGDGGDSGATVSETAKQFRGLAENARATAAAAEESARKKEATSRAGSLFELALSTRQLADDAFDREDFTRARTLYTDAIEQFLKAENLAIANEPRETQKSTGETSTPPKTERKTDPAVVQRRQADRAENAMQQARVKADRADAQSTQAYVSARNKESEARRLYSAGSYSQAAATFNVAAGYYEYALQEQSTIAEAKKSADTQTTKKPAAEKNPDAELASEVEKIHTDLQTARNRLDPAIFSLDSYRRAQSAENRGNEARENGDLATAREAYQHAIGLYAKAVQDHRGLIGEVNLTVERYRRAVEDKNLKTMKQIYPNLSKESEDNWKLFFRNVKNLQVEMNTTQTTVKDASAVAEVQVRLQFDGAGGSANWNNWQISLQQNAGTWQISKIIQDR